MMNTATAMAATIFKELHYLAILETRSVLYHKDQTK